MTFDKTRSNGGAGDHPGGRLSRGVVPPGTYATGGRSPVVYVSLPALRRVRPNDG
jgi:hypothetical protein